MYNRVNIFIIKQQVEFCVLYWSQILWIPK